MHAKAEKLALFRYGLIAPLVLEPLARGELTRRAEEIASRRYGIPDSKCCAVSVDTLLDWLARYRHGGFEALAPKPRQDRGQSRAITWMPAWIACARPWPRVAFPSASISTMPRCTARRTWRALRPRSAP